MRRCVIVGVALVGVAGPFGCGRAAPADTATAPAPAAPGEPLVLQDTAPATAAACPSCGVPAGPQHRCGRSRWCADCGVDATPTGHVCHVSRFCRACGCEAAVAGHRCGETRFDPRLNAPVERDDAEADE